MNDNAIQHNTKSDDELVADYILLRDAKTAIKKKHEAEIAKYTAVMVDIANSMLERLNERGADSTKTSQGTAYKQTIAQPTLVDRDKFLDYVIDHAAWDLFTNHVSKDAVENIIELTGAPPPGVDVDRRTVVNFRRS